MQTIPMHVLTFDVVWSVCLCVLVIQARPAKTAELTEMPFKRQTRVNSRIPRNHKIKG